MRVLEGSSARGTWARFAASAATALVVVGGGDASAGSGRSPSTRTPPLLPAEVGARAALDRVPVAFDANAGQFDARVRFVARPRGFTAFLTDDGATFSFGGSRGPDPRAGDSNAPCGPRGPSAPDALAMRFVGAAPEPTPRGGHPLPGRSNYFLGADPSGWRTGVPQFAEVTQHAMWPGIDVRWHGDARVLEYDLVVAPGADVDRAALRFDGAAGVSVSADGSLAVATRTGVLRHSAPVAYEVKDGLRRRLPSAFDMRADGTVGFRVDGRDPALPLVVDPKLGYGSYLGGSTYDQGNTIAVDSAGDVYVAGFTNSTNFPVVGAFQSTYTPSTGNPPNDTFVWKMRGDGTSVVYSTYLGGSGFDECQAIALDASNAAYLAGYTSSTNFPTQSPIQAAHGGGTQDGYVVKLAASGSSLVWSTYLGGSNTDIPYGVAVDASENCFVGGMTYSTNFPVANARQAAFGGTYDGFVTKINPSGSGFAYSTYHGGSGVDSVQALTVDAGGACYVCGFTGSTNFPVANAFQGSYTPSTGNPPDDGFVSKFNSTGSSLTYSTYIGGGGFDELYSIAIDSAGAAHVCGITSSANYPTASAYQPGKAGGAFDTVLTKLSSNGSQLVYSTYVGGGGRDMGVFVGVEASGAVYLVGQTESSDFPSVSAYQPTYRGGSGNFPDDAFVFKMKADGTGPVYSTFLGGSGFDDCYGCAVDGTGAVFITGITNSTDFPTSLGGLQGSYGGGYDDAYVVRLDPNAPSPPTGLTADQNTAQPIGLRWTDESVGETGFEIERKRGAGQYAFLASVGPDTTFYADGAIFPSTTFTYRVRAVNSEGASAYSNEASSTTPGSVPIPPPPATPGGIALVVVGSSEIDVSWTDRSNDETGFSLARRTGGSTFDTLASVAAGVTAYDDPGLHPGWPYSYKVRAFAMQGPSGFDGPATATPPATFAVAAAKGALTDSSKPGKDKVSVSGTLALSDTARTDPIDLVAAGISLQVGSPAGPLDVKVPPGDPGWKVKKTKSTWKSPKGTKSKTSIVFDSATGAFALSITGTDLPVPPSPTVRVLVASAADGGGTTADWREKKPGVFVYP